MVSPEPQRPLAFLCHSSGDKGRVRDLYSKLTGDGVKCWFDEEDLLPGQDWDYEITRAIRGSKFVLTCLSNSSVTKSGYVQKELKKALDVADEQPEGVAYIIPVRLEDCEVPQRLQRWHWVDLYRENGYARLLRTLRPTRSIVEPRYQETGDSRRSADRLGVDRPRSGRAPSHDVRTGEGGWSESGSDRRRRESSGALEGHSSTPDQQSTFVNAPPLPDSIMATALDPAARRDLGSLERGLAESVARHLVAAGLLVDEDPKAALAHARYARRRAPRIAVVREAAGIAAYHAEEWAEALAELRATRRMGGGPGHLAVMADIERAMERPERALELARSPEARELSRSAQIELAIVVAGAHRDLGELEAAVVGLQIPELDAARRDPWSARLFYAYADNLLAAGHESDALQWFVYAVDADTDGQTDAQDRIAELTGEPPLDDGIDFGVDDGDIDDGDIDDEARDETADEGNPLVPHQDGARAPSDRATTTAWPGSPATSASTSPEADPSGRRRPATA